MVRPRGRPPLALVQDELRRASRPRAGDLRLTLGGRSAPRRIHRVRAAADRGDPRPAAGEHAGEPAARARLGSVRAVALPAARLGRDGDAGQLLRNRRATWVADAGRGGRHADADVTSTTCSTSRPTSSRIPTRAFDVVIFAEMIEHLAINPIWTLAEIHRVLKPDGHLIVTTPNALSIERVGSVLTGRRPFVDHYSPAFGYGARHNREYACVRAVHGARGDRLRHRVDDRTRSGDRRDAGAPPPRCPARAAASLLADLPASAPLRARAASTGLSMAVPAGAVHAAERLSLRPLSLGGDGGERHDPVRRGLGSRRAAAGRHAGCVACSAIDSPCPVDRRSCAAPPAGRASWSRCARPARPTRGHVSGSASPGVTPPDDAPDRSRVVDGAGRSLERRGGAR